MREPHGEGPATHTGSESCMVARKGHREALTGERTGQVLNRENPETGTPTLLEFSGRPHPSRRYRKTWRGPARPEILCTYGRTSYGNREIPCPPAALGVAGRVGKPKGGRRR